MNTKTRRALERIANVAWEGYGQAHCKEIYEICRDEIGVMAGRQWRKSDDSSIPAEQEKR